MGAERRPMGQPDMQLATRVPVALKKRVKLAVIAQGTTMQAYLTAAVTEKLERDARR